MLKIFAPVLLFVSMPFLVSGAPSSMYGKALQKAKSVSEQAQRTRTIAPEQKTAPAAVKTTPVKAKEFAAAVKNAKMKKFPVSGVKGMMTLLQKKIVTPEMLGLPKDKKQFTEKELPIAWFGTEANQAKNDEKMPLFVVKPGRGEIIAGFQNGDTTVIAKAPRTVTGAVSILRSASGNKKSPLWEQYLKRARSIDRASK